ncbi:MAG: hypothetical protein KA715_13600 [Xanthomonadaceae bacterium]|nr:hypothetical protein [Xanthomonadaceae bacterium]
MMNRVLFKPKNSNQVHWSALRVNGVDARDFLHRMTTVNMRELEVGKAAEGLLLTPQGKIQAYFYLSCLREGEYVLECDAGANGFWLRNLKEKLEFYHFGEKIEFTVLIGEYEWRLGSGWDSGIGENEISPIGDGWIVRHSDSKFGQAWVSVYSRGKITRSEALEVSWSDLNDLRVENGTAWWGIEIQPDSNPLDLALVSAIADQKGCYPGQEVIEKIIALGSPAKRLCLVVDEIGVKSLSVLSKTKAVVGGSILKVF